VDKPVFLSIGYSTCHWCHVMEKESFEEPGIAALMNETFVSVKVDREERPDIDAHFMEVSRLVTGSGGWPLTVIMTPDAEPFFVATYIPPDTMRELVPSVRRMWAEERGDLLGSARSIAAALVEPPDASAPRGYAPTTGGLERAVTALERHYDAEHGGFGSAPKFPMTTVVSLLLRAGTRRALGMAVTTLVAMRNGGIHDHVGGGFHRYSTDAEWRVPHFEKMLYDQALAAIAYTEAWQATGRAIFRETARDILDYVLRDLSLPAGGFAAAEDADSEGVEGRFYLWTADGIRRALGDGAGALLRRHDVGEEGEHILHRDLADEDPAPDLGALRAARDLRPRPLRDDKLLTDWNGLVIAALARGGSVLGEPRFVDAAARAARFILGEMRRPDGRLLHRWREGEAVIDAFADDYAFLSWGLLELYAAGFEAAHLAAAMDLARVVVEDFRDPASGAFFRAPPGGDRRIIRRAELGDGVIPSAQSVLLHVLLRLERLTAQTEYRRLADGILAACPPDADGQPTAFSFLLAAAAFRAGPAAEVVVCGRRGAADTVAMLAALRARFLPNLTVIFRGEGEEEEIDRIAPFAASCRMVNGRATAYACRDFTCSLPTNDPAAMIERLGV